VYAVYDIFSFCKYLVIACPPLTAPDNGGIDCSLGDDGHPSLGDTCTFTCDDDYFLSGSESRSCQVDGRWSGTVPMCIRSMLIRCKNAKFHVFLPCYPIY